MNNYTFKVFREPAHDTEHAWCTTRGAAGHVVVPDKKKGA